ncbi:MAG: hypothetical protein K2P58_00435 [Hyphomonadaceae bacterium]|nr:hypothetical protein [Hyphomonadaceae bacterium]
MTFIIRWPAILVLLALVLISLGAAVATALVLGGAPVDLATVFSQDQIDRLGSFSWVEVGLWAAAGVLFLVSAVRLIRRTQGFWAWLLGFACYGGRWAWSQQAGGGDIVAQVQSIDVNVYRQPVQLTSATESTEAQLAILAILLILGVLIWIVDAADRAYWNREGA